ncbi:MAG: hypothetical protein LBV74_05395 [Tannerella sp.]|jgi:hypothetical protein|nr:hypothetical protein [Tannerella sp.]
MKYFLEKISIGIFILVFIVSCTSDDVFEQKGGNVVSPEEVTFKVPEDDAREILTAFVQQFEANSADAASTKSEPAKTIKDVQALTSRTFSRMHPRRV